MNIEAISLKDLAGKLREEFLPKLSSQANPYSENETDINRILSEAIKSNEITPAQANALRQNYKPTMEDCAKLRGMIKELNNGRIKALMCESYDELDKSGHLAELKEKFYDGFQIKWILKFGKPYNDNTPAKPISASEGKINKTLLEYAIDSGAMNKEDAAGFERMATTNEMLRDRIIKHIESCNGFTWEQLDKAGLLPKIKKADPLRFKRLFKEKFGIEYQDNK
jgi:hypothetical protein